MRPLLPWVVRFPLARPAPVPQAAKEEGRVLVLEMPRTRRTATSCRRWAARRPPPEVMAALRLAPPRPLRPPAPPGPRFVSMEILTQTRRGPPPGPLGAFPGPLGTPPGPPGASAGPPQAPPKPLRPPASRGPRFVSMEILSQTRGGPPPEPPGALPGALTGPPEAPPGPPGAPPGPRRPRMRAAHRPPRQPRLVQKGRVWVPPSAVCGAAWRSESSTMRCSWERGPAPQRPLRPVLGRRGTSCQPRAAPRHVRWASMLPAPRCRRRPRHSSGQTVRTFWGVLWGMPAHPRERVLLVLRSRCRPTRGLTSGCGRGVSRLRRGRHHRRSGSPPLLRRRRLAPKPQQGRQFACWPGLPFVGARRALRAATR